MPATCPYSSITTFVSPRSSAPRSPRKILARRRMAKNSSSAVRCAEQKKMRRADMYCQSWGVAKKAVATERSSLDGRLTWQAKEGIDLFFLRAVLAV